MGRGVVFKRVGEAYVACKTKMANDIDSRRTDTGRITIE